MATMAQTSAALQGVQSSGSAIMDNLLRRKKAEEEAAANATQEAYLAKSRPISLRLSEAQAQTGEATASGAKRDESNAAALDAANGQAITDAQNNGWAGMQPDEQQALQVHQGNLNRLNLALRAAGKPAMSPQDYLTGIRGTKEKAAEDKAKAEADIGKTKAETVKALRDRPDPVVKWNEGMDDQGNKYQLNPVTGEKRYLGIKGHLPGVNNTPVSPSDIADKSLAAANIIDQMIGSADGKIKPHPGFTADVGAKGASSLWGLRSKPIPGTDAANFQSLLDQSMGGAFMEARQGLKGGGAITDFEGKKAEQAVTRMNTAQSESAFIDAAKEFRSQLLSAAAKARKAAESSPAQAQTISTGVLTPPKSNQQNNLRSKYGY